MSYQVNFGSIGAGTADKPRRAAGGTTAFRLAVLGDFSARANRGELATGDELAARKPLKADVDTLDDIIERQGIEIELPIGDDGAAVELSLTCLDDFHPDELYDNLEIFDELTALRQRLENSSTFDGAAREVLSWGAEAEPKKRRKAKARGSVVPVGGKLSDFARLTGRPTAGDDAETSIDELLKQIVGPHVVAEKDPRQEQLVAKVDEALSGTMRAVLHHPDFQYLESLWRSIDLLVRRLETSSQLQIVLYDITAEEIAADLSAAEDLEESGLYKLLVEQPALDAHQGALSAIIGCYTFEMTPPHAELLGRIAKIAAQAQAPFVTSLGADVLSFKFDDLHPLIKESWGALKELPEAAYLGLGVPRFMLRLPYGRKTDPIDPFDFEEFTPHTGLKSMLWANPAILAGLLLGETFSRQGAAMDLGSIMSVDDIPYYFYNDPDGDQTALPCTERLIPIRMAEQVSAQRLMPVLSIRGRPEIRLGSFQSLGGVPLAGLWTGPAAAAAEAAKAAAEAAAAAAKQKEEASDDEDGDDMDDLMGDMGGDDDEFDMDSLGLDEEEDEGDDDLDALLGDLGSDDDDGDDDDEMDPDLADLLKDL